MACPAAPFARGPVLLAGAVLLAVLLLTAAGYGYHRDELYFRMLTPAWGYVDQPPLTPLVVGAVSAISDSVVAVRIVPAVLAALSVVVVALVAREAGGGRGAQALAAWGYSTGTFTLIAGHVFLTSSWDLVVWPLVLLAVVRARLRADPRWWLLAGAVAGLSLANKLLVAVLLAGIVVGLAVTAPRDLLNRWTVAAAALTVVLGAPSLAYQVVQGFPQLAMGRALGENNGAEVRPQVVPFLFILLGPPLSLVWLTALVALARRPAWRPIRLLLVAFPVVVMAVVAMGTQAHYPYGMLAVLFALGCVPVAEWARSRVQRRLVVAGVALNALVSAVVALPLVPAGVLGATPIPGMNQAAADTVGWERVVAQIRAVAEDAGPDAVVLTANYGEAGALDRFAPELTVVSGHNALATQSAPPDGTRTVVAVGVERIRESFGTCREAAILDNGVDVENEEQGVPVLVCTDPLVPTAAWWAATAHLD